MVIERCFKNRFETKKTLYLIRWTILIYTIVTFIFYFIEIAMHPEEYAFINRATGPYAFAYWIMLLSASILPLTLFNKKLASKFWYVLLVAFAMKSGMYFERFVIIVTSFHRDYLPGNSNTELIDVFFFGIGMLFLQGVLIAIFTLGIFEIIKKQKKGQNTF